MKIETILEKKGNKPLISVEKNMKAIDAVRILDEKHIGALIVVDKSDNVVGIITERDFLFKSYKMAGSKRVRELVVGDLMTDVGKLYVAKSNDNVQDIMKLMLKRKIRHVPIMDDGAIVGLVSIGDILSILLETYEEEAFKLRQHIQNPMGIHLYGDGHNE